MKNLFAGRQLVIATMHGKEEVIQPHLEEALGVDCILIDQLDTDQFGTFTRERKRPGSMLETARAKVAQALKASGADLGIASEGSFGMHPSLPFVMSNYELTLLVDTKHQLEVAGDHHTVETNVGGRYVTSVDQAVTFADQHGFPQHGMIVRRRKERNWAIYKDLVNRQAFETRVARMLRRPFTSRVYIETDMRAHRNPTRMQAIAASIQDLISNAQSYCPRCEMPGFRAKGVTGALLCERCRQPTRQPTHQVYQCQSCRYHDKQLLDPSKNYADPSRCRYCNP